MRYLYLLIIILFAGCKTRQVVKTQKDSVKVTHAVEKGIDTTHKTTDNHFVEAKHTIIITKSGKIIDITPTLGTYSKVGADGSYYGVASHITTMEEDNSSTDNTINSDLQEHAGEIKGVDTTKIKSDSTAVKTKTHIVNAKANNSYSYVTIACWIATLIAGIFCLNKYTKVFDFLTAKK